MDITRTRRGLALVLAALITIGAALSLAAPTPPVSAGSPPVLVKVPVLQGVQKMASGYFHRCAIKSGGKVWCWGYGLDGRLGNGDIGNRAVATRVVGVDDAVDIAAGMHHTCVIRADATVWCWGDNAFGQLGTSSAESSDVPVAVPGVTGASHIWAGIAGTCATVTGEKLKCWGYNAQHAFTATNAVSIPPTVMPSMAGVLDVAISISATCVILADDSVHCWGDESKGELGDDGSADSAFVASSDAVEPVGMQGILALDAGGYTFCAVKDAGVLSTTWCWGGNDSGVAGQTVATTTLAKPTAVSGILNATDVEVSMMSACVRRETAQITCWGSDVAITGLTGATVTPTLLPDTDVQQISVAAYGQCVVNSSHFAVCSGIDILGTQGGASGNRVATSSLVLAPELDYRPIAPITLMDTRKSGSTVDGTLLGGGRLAPRTTVPIQVTGRPGVGTGGSSVALRVRAAGADRAGTLVISRCGASMPKVTTLAFPKKQARVTTTLVRLSGAGAVCVRSNRAVQVVVDLIGRQGSGSAVHALRSARLVDTRKKGRTIDGKYQGGGVTGPGQRTIKVLGRGGLPTAGVQAVLLQVTAGDGGQGAGTLLWTGCESITPIITSAAFSSKGWSSTLVVARVDDLGRTCVHASKATQMTVDVVGLLEDTGSPATFLPVTLVDTRPGAVTATGDHESEGSGAVLSDMSVGMVSATVGASSPLVTSPRTVFLSVTADRPTGRGSIIVWPCGSARPTHPTLTVTKGRTTSAMAILAVPAEGTICIRSTVATHLKVALVGRLLW